MAGNELHDAWSTLQMASDLAADRIWLDPGWDLVYATLGTAILAIQAATDQQLPGGEPDPPDPSSCADLLEDATRLLAQVDLAAHPTVAAAITAVADARCALRDLAA